MTTNYFKGMCYAAFPQGYDPSTANKTCIFFGSDITSKNLKPLWGKGFSPLDGPDKDKIFLGRDDLLTMSKMGVNTIRLYDWDARNDHQFFLDYCYSLKIQVLVPVSNYNLGAFGTAPNMDSSILGLMKSFSNKDSSDYHPAIAAILIGSEIDLPSQMAEDYVTKYTRRWVELEHDNWRKVPIGHPISFATHGAEFPCFKFWDHLLDRLGGNLNERLILCPNPYTDAFYLFENAQEKGKGWVDITYDRYKLPILFTEIGCSRLTRPDYNDVIAAQLERSHIYHKENPEKLLGTCFFQFCDKAWKADSTEGSYGIFSNTKLDNNIIRYGAKDFTHTDGNNCTKEFLRVSVLSSNPVFNTIKLIYTC